MSAGVGYDFARRSDERLWSDQRVGLRNAIAEFRALFDRGDELDPRFVRMVEQGSGLKSLRFETAPQVGKRESQPVLDSDGRIVGFFTWERSYPMTQLANRLVPLVSGLVAVLVAFGGFTLQRLRRARNELAASAEQASRAAELDKLTGLPNHDKTLALLDLALAARESGQVTTFALIEIDGIADVNANFGELASDQLYGLIARRLTEALPADAVCGRTGTNEFAVTVTGGSQVDAEVTVRTALDAIGHSYWIDTVVRVSAHAGLAQAPDHGASRGELARRAGLALRVAARRGPGTVVTFDHSIDAVSADQKFIHRELPRALSANELEVHYQPIVSSRGARIVGVEALLRWTHAARGPIEPATFVPVAEQMGLMDALGDFVLRRALLQARRWPGLYVAVNLSPVQVHDRALVDQVRAALAESGVPPQRLMLEITEGVLIANPEEMLGRINELHALGVRIALDDFGSGYSNLGYLQRFPIDKLKIDRSFVASLGQSANGGVIVQAIVALGHALGLSVLVEGVETEEQRVLLRLAGCDEMQGFLFARPAPARAVDKLLAQAREGSARTTLPGGEPLTA